MQKRMVSVVSLVLLAVVFSCGGQQGTSAAPAEFDAASAYGFVKAQVEFGPRVPGTPAHAACAEWLAKTLRQWTPDVVVQEFKARAYDGRPLAGKNIIASFNAEAGRTGSCSARTGTPGRSPTTIPDPANHFKPVMGANDGASGVGVLLEVARCLSLSKPAVGVDILLLDLEDFGEHANWRGSSEDSWGLGSQHWAKNPSPARLHGPASASCSTWSGPPARRSRWRGRRCITRRP